MKLDQKGCRYTPHVFGVRAGQPLEISNSDPTLHNVHAMGRSNQEFNLSQPIQGMKNTKTFTAPEVMVHFKCDVHSWMNAYVGVLDHPYFAVTANGGAFELKNLPPGPTPSKRGTRSSGTQTQSVTLGEKESKTVTFTFKARTGVDRDLAAPLLKLVAACTVLLIAAGGMVTSTDSGLAVPDWPNTYG